MKIQCWQGQQMPWGHRVACESITDMFVLTSDIKHFKTNLKGTFVR